MEELFQDILKPYGVKYTELTEEEKETLYEKVNAMQKSELSIDSVRDFIKTMKAVVENDLTKCDLGKNQDLFLKARLRNLLMLEAFMGKPEEAKQALDEALSGLKKK